MMIFMENTKQELTIVAFDVFELNLGNFLMILNSAYTFFALLKGINNWIWTKLHDYILIKQLKGLSLVTKDISAP